MGTPRLSGMNYSDATLDAAWRLSWPCGGWEARVSLKLVQPRFLPVQQDVQSSFIA